MNSGLWTQIVQGYAKSHPNKMIKIILDISAKLCYKSTD